MSFRWILSFKVRILEQKEFDENVISLLQSIEKLTQLKQKNQSHKTLVQMNDIDIALAIDNLLDLAAAARLSDLDYPKALSYFLIDLLVKRNVELERNKEAELVKAVNKYQDFYNLRKLNSEIFLGRYHYSKNKRKGRLNPSLMKDVELFINSEGSQRKGITPARYAQGVMMMKDGRMTMSDIKLFYQLYFYKSESSVDRLFKEYKFSEVFKSKL